MKKIIITTIAMIFVLCGCSNSTLSKKQADSTIQESSSVQTVQEDESTETVPEEKSWTKEEVQSLFIKSNQNSMHNLTIVGAVVVPDFAYNLVGAVLYVDNEKQTSNVAFLDSDGYYQTSGVYANLYANSEFTYCGDGTVTFKLETETGTVYTFRLSISIDGPNVNFVASDDLEKQME